MNPEVWITRPALKYVRRTARTSRRVCSDLNHARNLSRKAIREGEATRIQVWVDETTRYVWTPDTKWTGPETSDRRAKWPARNPI